MTERFLRALVLLAAAPVVPAAPALADAWCSTDAGMLEFTTSFEGERLPGRFREFDVRLDFDPAKPGAASLRVTVDLGEADLGDPEMNAVLHDPVWLDVAGDPQAVYRSTAIERTDDDGFVATGTLELKDRRQQVRVPFRWQSSGDRARMQGNFDLTRTDFDVGTGEWADGDAIGLAVSVAFDVELESCD